MMSNLHVHVCALVKGSVMEETPSYGWFILTSPKIIVSSGHLR